MAAISVQEDGGGDYTTLEAAVENASTADGDVITITETWSSSENTQIAVTDALTIQATGASKHIGRPHNGSETTFRHRNSSSGHSFTITDTGIVTFIGMDIQNTSTGTSDEVFRNNVSNTFLAQDCVLGFASRNDQQDIYYNEQTVDATFESCHFYNAFRAVVDLSGPDAGSSVKINSCTSFDIGFSTGSTSRSGIVGSTASSATLTIDIYNCVFHMNTGTVLRHQINGNVTSTTERVITNAANINSDSSTNDVLNATISDVDSAGNYILLDTTTSPYDLRLLDSANNAAQDNHSSATGAGLTIPAVDIVGTSRPQNTDFDVGAFEVVASSGNTLAADSGAYTYSGTDAGLTATRILTADSGTYTYTGTDATLTFAPVGNFTLTADTGSYTYTGTNADLLKGSVIVAESGGYTYTGTAVTLTFGAAGDFTLVADSGSYVYTGTAIGLTSDRLLSADSGSYVYTGTAIDLNFGFVLAADSGAYTYAGTNVGFVQQRILNAITGTYVYNGTDANIFFSPVPPDVPIAKGVTVNGAFGNGVTVTSAFGNGATVKGSL